MLVFVSDIHLTDGTSGETIKSGAFEKFTKYLKDMAETADAKDIEVVFLGDILDVIRSDYWLNTSIRPWSEQSDIDLNNGTSLKMCAEAIVSRICTNSENQKSVQFLSDFKSKSQIPVKFTYITGNHDWLINRYDSTRKMAADFLMVDGNYQAAKFATEGYWSDYSVFARHGDIFDPFNYDGKRDASSIGDAIVIDLLNKFPKAVEKYFATNDINDTELAALLKEVDNVRPLVDIPLWILGACRRAKTPETSERIKKIWNNLAAEFLSLDFIKKHNTWNPFEIVDALQLGLNLSKYPSLEALSNLPLRKFQKAGGDYTKEAYNESCIKEAEFVLYGHTHEYTIEPLDIVQSTSGVQKKTYINTGTWRKTHTRTAFDQKGFEFIDWYVMTFVAFYLDSERDDKRFETWNGALG